MFPTVGTSLLKAVGDLHIYINMAGYLFIATAVLILWVVSVFVFDQRTYMRVTPGQIQVCEHVGASIRNFDTTGLSFEKQRDDLFRHWLLGFFSGDLIVRTAGAEKETIRLPNVLWISWRLEEVQQLFARRQPSCGREESWSPDSRCTMDNSECEGPAASTSWRPVRVMKSQITSHQSELLTP